MADLAAREMAGNAAEDKFRVPVPLTLSGLDTSPSSNWLHQQTFIDGGAGTLAFRRL
jgi:hypothetical protein